MRFVLPRLLVLSIIAGTRASADVSVDSLKAQAEDTDKQLMSSRRDMEFVEKQYSQRDEVSDDDARRERYEKAVTRYLLEEYSEASVLFYDLVANKDFQTSRLYADALFYLADSLYRQKNYLGSRLYLKQLLALKQGHYKEALSRYLEIAGRLNEFAGIDEQINQARGLSGGELPAELSYVYAKWLFRREDMSVEDRVNRAIPIFANLAKADGGYHLQAQYFVAVGFVKLKRFDDAIAQFQQVAKASPRDERERQVKELANLSLGRVLFETGKYDEAIDRYQEIPRESDSFPDSLYETAWTYVKKGDFERAKNATDILLLVAENSVLAPEAQILQGTLLLKLKKYEEATETYNSVINQYTPVRDEIDALLTVNKDPAKYFDDLIARNDKTLDVGQLLPPAALKWATTQREVSEAVGIINNLESGRRGVEESQAIAGRILKGLDERGLEAFPILQEGYTRADAVDTSLTRIDEKLTAIETGLLAKYLAPEQTQALAKARADADALKLRIATLPATEAEVTARKDRMRAKVDDVDRRAFQAGVDLQSELAQLAAIQKYVDDTRVQRKNTADDEKAFLEKVTLERRGLEGIQGDLDKLRATLQDERNNADAALGGEDALRRQYNDALRAQTEILMAARTLIPNDAKSVLLQCDSIRSSANGLRDRVAMAKSTLRDRVSRRSQRLREMVQAEQSLLQSYGGEVANVSSDAKGLVGRIAFDSFKRVRQSFYDLVLKADVGVVDVAFTRKQDKTQEIQKLAAQKDRELHQLDEEFKEVLKDVD